MDKESDEFSLFREIAVAEMEEKYPDWDPYLAAQYIARWHQGLIPVSGEAERFQNWLNAAPPVEFFLSKREFYIKYFWRNWEKGSLAEGTNWRMILFCTGLKYMKTRVLLWQFVYGCFQAGFIPRRAPWE